MKRLVLLTLSILFIFACYVLHIFYSTGFFRAIENTFSGSIEQKISIPGVEDIQVSYEDDFLIFSSDDRVAHRDGKSVQGHLYYLDLKSNNFEPVQLTTNLKFHFFPHGISMIKVNENEYKVYAINHVRRSHSIEVFKLYGDSLVHTNTLKDESMTSPNDLVAIDENQFYFTNDHRYTKGFGKFREEYLGWAVSNVVYFDGAQYREVADGIAYANGINFDSKRNLLFVASPRDFIVKVYEAVENGNLNLIEDIYCGTGVDNIEFEPSGKLWIGCHPNLLRFTFYAGGKWETSPSEIITIDYRNTNDFTKEVLFLDDGRNISASTVAVPYKNYIFTGNVMDKHFLVLKTDSNNF